MIVLIKSQILIARRLKEKVALGPHDIYMHALPPCGRDKAADKLGDVPHGTKKGATSVALFSARETLCQ